MSLWFLLVLFFPLKNTDQNIFSPIFLIYFPPLSVYIRFRPSFNLIQPGPPDSHRLRQTPYCLARRTSALVEAAKQRHSSILMPSAITLCSSSSPRRLTLIGRSTPHTGGVSSCRCLILGHSSDAPDRLLIKIRIELNRIESIQIESICILDW